VVGLTFNHRAGDFYRALLEGVTYEMNFNLECLAGAGVEVRELRAVGGGAKSDLWLQIKADIMNRKVSALDVDEAGTLGAAILAGTATGVYASLSSAAGRLVKIRKVFHPQPRHRGIYLEQYARYKKMYEAVKHILKKENHAPGQYARAAS
jgi:xylulokinase